LILRRHTDAERDVGDEEHRLAAKEEAGEAHRCAITRTDAAVRVDEFRRRALETARAFFPGRFATEHAYVKTGAIRGLSKSGMRKASRRRCAQQFPASR